MRCRLKLFTAALDRSYHPEQFFLANGRIIYRMAIAARNQEGMSLVDYPMCEQPVMACKEHNIADLDLVEAPTLHGHEIAWPDGRQHARSGESQPDFAEAANDLRNERTLYAVVELRLLHASGAV